MIRTAIVLAGGFGTRLKSVVQDVPKPMAPVCGKPFLEYVLLYLQKQRIENVILSTGYKQEVIENFFGNGFRGMNLLYSREQNPLGTGGAIAQALKFCTDAEVAILNGDTFFPVTLSELEKKHRQNNAVISVAARSMKSFSRYGKINATPEGRILSFEEKGFFESGIINGGAYVLNTDWFRQLQFPEKFSWEKDVLEKFTTAPLFAFPSQTYFIDIGIPEDYSRAGSEMFWFAVDRSWTLFLDRDGVINKKIEGDYVRNLNQFSWLPGVQEAILTFSKMFGRIIIVSNQQGVGKNLMSNADVEKIHEHITTTIAQIGGRIDAVYFAPQLGIENSIMRKPQTGMALQAKEDFPEIDFKKSIMIGDSISDMQFAANAGMHSVLLHAGVRDDYKRVALPGLPELISYFSFT